MDVIYYHYFLFYQKVLKEDNPHEVTRWALSVSIGFFLMPIIDFLAIKFFCYRTIALQLFLPIPLLYVINYFIYYKSKRDKFIIKEKPMLFGSRKISIFITLLFFLITVSSIFIGPIFSKYCWEIYCK